MRPVLLVHVQDVNAQAVSLLKRPETPDKTMEKNRTGLDHQILPGNISASNLCFSVGQLCGQPHIADEDEQPHDS